MKFEDVVKLEAESLTDLINLYCFRCSRGIAQCPIRPVDCWIIKTDKEYKKVTGKEF